MEKKEKVLYHQVHPLKLWVDIFFGFFSLYFFWKHDLILALITGFGPPLLSSLLMVYFMDFEKQKNSPLGKYISKHLNRKTEGIRLLGYLTMAAGAWFYFPFAIITGLLIIFFSWTWGWFFRKR